MNKHAKSSPQKKQKLNSALRENLKKRKTQTRNLRKQDEDNERGVKLRARLIETKK